MSDASPSGFDPLDTDEPAVDLIQVEKHLAPIRRVVAYAVEHPAGVVCLETNIRRWLTPLLALDLPSSIRETLVVVAGRLAGMDAEPDQDRLREIRASLTRLDAVLGLPIALPSRRRPRDKTPKDKPPKDKTPKDRSPKGSRSRGGGDADERADDTHSDTDEDGKGGRNRRRRGRKGSERSSTSAEVDELDDLLEIESEPTPKRRRSRGFWDGNAFTALSELDLAPELVERFAAAGLTTVADVLFLKVVENEVLKPIHGAGRALPEGRVAVGGRVVGTHSVLRPDGTELRRVTLRGAGRLHLDFEQPAAFEALIRATTVGDRVVVVGTHAEGRLVDPECVVEDGKVVRVSRYHLAGIDDSEVSQLLFRLLPGVPELRDPLPDALQGKEIPHRDAVLALHGRGDAGRARERMAFEEAMGLSLAHAWDRLGSRKRRGIAHTIGHSSVDILLTTLDVRLADAAEAAFDDIRRDLRRNRPMRRVLFGEPGGGKSLVALLAAVVVAEGKSQVLWVCDDPLHAQSQFAFASPMLELVGLRAAFLDEGASPSKKLRQELEKGECHVLFTCLPSVSTDLSFRRLGLVVSIERTANHGELSKRDLPGTPPPDLLVVPTTFPTVTDLLGPWSDHDLSWIPGPPEPEMMVTSVTAREDAYRAARDAVASRQQVTVLFPQLNGRDALDVDEAQRVLRVVGERLVPGSRTMLLHGSMTQAERVATVHDFSHRRADVIVCTLPLEDLPPLPGLTVAVVEHAERLSDHRLRRVRGLGASRLELLVGDDVEASVRDSLLATVKGQGQPEAPSPMRFFDPALDLQRLIDARGAAAQILTDDPSLRSATHWDLLRLTHLRWSLWSDEECPLPQPGEAPSSPGSSGAAAQKRRRRRRRRR